MDSNNEPKLEEYGLTSSSYEDYRNKKNILEDNFKKLQKEIDVNFKKNEKDIENSFEDFKKSNRSDLNKFIINPLIFISAIGGLITLVAESNYFWLFLFVFILFNIISSSNDNKIENTLINPQKIEIDNKLKLEKVEKNNKLELAKKDKEFQINSIKNKVYPFEEACGKYYEEYLERFFKQNLYKKHSGSEVFEKSLAEFSMMVNQVKEEIKDINEKIIFRHISPYYHESYLEGRQINHNFQKEKKQLFHSFNDIKNTSDYIKLDDKNKSDIKDIKINPNQKIKEEFWNNRDKKILDNIKNSKETNSIAVEEKIYPKEGLKINDNSNDDKLLQKPIDKGFWPSIMEGVHEEIEKANSNTLNKEIINTIDIVSPDKTYSAPRKIDWENINKHKSITGLKGEEIAVEIEKEYLKSINREDLAERVKQVSLDGDGFGYDILSYFPDGQEKYIEVKSSKNSNSSSFNISSNELDFMKRNQYNYQIWRMFNINENENEEIPTLKVHKADDILTFKKITPVQYVVKME